MKNIFLIPTDKESRLWRDLDSNKLTFDNLSHSNSNECTKCSHEYGYITSDEKFIRDEYVTDGLEVIKSTPKLVDAQGLVNRRDWKKIVMTNDLELIESGIQQIGDLFFRWFVKNPSCEEVEVKKEKIRVDKDFNDISHWNRFVHKIIIPEEETLSEKLEKIVSKEPSKFVEESNERFRIREEKKLKEAFDEIYKLIDFTEFDFASFKLGVKWEQERNK